MKITVIVEIKGLTRKIVKTAAVTVPDVHSFSTGYDGEQQKIRETVTTLLESLREK